MVPVSFSLSAMVSFSCSAENWDAGVLVEIALFLQGTQHSFQKRKRKTATRASPHTITITARRLMESSGGQEKVTVEYRIGQRVGKRCQKWVGKQGREGEKKIMSVRNPEGQEQKPCTDYKISRGKQCEERKALF